VEPGGTQTWIGLDVGTTSLKAVAYDRSGRILAQGRTPTVWRTTPHGAELDPAALLEAALNTLGAVAQQLPGDTHVAGVGITSMGEVGVLVDARGEVVAPAIAWHDTRDDVEVAELAADIGAREFAARTGKPLRGQFSITKHRWLMRHHEPARNATRRFGVADWVVRGLGAGEICDRTLACRTGWYDVVAGDWWDDGLSWSQASRALQPELVDPGTAIGRVTDGPDRLRGAVVTTAGHDHQAAALGVGATAVGDEVDSSGTAEALVRTVPPVLTRDQLVVLAEQGITTDVSIQPGRWSLLGATEGGLELQRTLDQLGAVPADLDGAALGSRSEAGRRWRAAVEEATDQARRLHEALIAVAGPHHRFVVTGGWARSTMVLDAKRRAFGPLTVADVPEAGSLGAATLAARATGDVAADGILA
jgi:sugar (pentulose or hexulose) kinase